MANVLLRSDLDKLVLLEWRGQPAVQSYSILSNLLAGVSRTKLGFAEPLVRWPRGDEGGEITWYADDGAGLRPLSTYPDDQRDGFVHNLGAEIARVREAVSCEGRAQALLLDRALVIPDPEAVFTDGRVFLLAPWGALSGNGGALKTESEGVDFAGSVLGRLTGAESEPVVARVGDGDAEKLDPLETLLPGAPASDAAGAPGAAASLPPWSVPIASVTYGTRMRLSRPVAAVLHGLTFICFFALAVWAAFSIAAHTRIVTISGHIFSDPSR
ncbi:hypothetical protein [Gluconacetobacter takamatsuzukensis]|uniref:Uncharacterized protein n=1 Tax=Gluconacetobacter takamatsuzukensis TaxID=1286190 RepID=A0A7W4KGK5_9PROT|nr:hypothetical protein [Gluconacetobacter takamatsuzukensis]MBB2206430.1 hypothetical protein [Gluconacetobacter takamatsuzukensis]